MPSTQPNTSVYVKNINTKVKKPELRRQLHALFSTYGKVLDVVATRADGMRGQAFIVFHDLQSATAALRGLDGFEFYEKPLSIDYARSKSRATIVNELGPEALFDPAIMASERGKPAGGPGKVTISSAQAEARGKDNKRTREDATGEEEDEEDEDEDGERDGKRRTKQQSDEDDEAPMEEDSDAGSPPPGPVPVAESATPAAPMGPPQPAAGQDPNPVLYCADLPAEVSDDMLGVLFQQYPGFKSVQLFPARPSRTPPGAHGFVEFESTEQAGVAREALDEFRLAPGKTLSVSWASRAKA